MLLEKLIEFRERDDIDEQIIPPYFKNVKITWALELDKEGRFKGWASVDRKEPAPYRGRSGSKPAPYLLVDTYPYWLGMSLQSEDMTDEKAKERWEMFLELTQSLHQSMQTTPLNSYSESLLAFLTSEEERRLAAQEARGKVKKGDFIAPVVDGEFVHRMKLVGKFWRRVCDAEAEAKASVHAICMICQVESAIPQTHPVEFLIGPNRTKIVSGNENAFESFGLKKGENSPVCQGCARGYGEGMRYLLNHKNHTIHVGDVRYVFWTRQPQDDFSWGSLLVRATPEEVKALYDSASRGDQSRGVAQDTFYALGLTANTARLVVRDWIEESLEVVQANVSTWFENQSLDDARKDEPVAPKGVYALASATLRTGQKAHEDKRVSTHVVPALFRAAILGLSLPSDLLVNVLQRLGKDDLGITPARAVLLKLTLNDLLKRMNYPKEDMVKERLDVNNRQPGYLYGRLMSVLEQVQQAALGHSLNATVVDRFWGTASTAPRAVFPTLMRTSQAHLQKIRRTNAPAHYRLQRHLEEIYNELNHFEPTLTLEQQGLFALGYYHECAARTRRISAHTAEQSSEE